MSISSVGCLQKAIVFAAALIFSGTFVFNPPSHAQELRAKGLGLVDSEFAKEYQKGEFFPAVIFRTNEGALYLLTSTYASPQFHRLCYIENGKLDMIPSGDWLENTTSHASMFGPEVYSYYIPTQDLDQNTQSLFDRIAVSEREFAPAQVGLPVKLLGQTLNFYTAGQDSRGIIAASGHTVYGGRFANSGIDGRAIEYSLILPGSRGCPPMSWVQLGQQSDNGQARYVGLIVSHLPYKQGDCFLDVDALKLICSQDLIRSMMDRSEEQLVMGGTSKSGLIYDLKSLRSSDNWRATGERIRRFDPFSALRHETHEPKNFGIACNLIQSNEKAFLLIDAAYTKRLKVESKACFRIGSEVKSINVNDHFLWATEHHIAIDDSLIALPSRSDSPVPESIIAAAHQLDTAFDPEEGIDAIYGTSHTDGVMRARIEESLVYYLDVAFTQEDYGLKPVPSFNAGVYPTALFGVKDNRPRFFGILGFNKQTQEPTIYSATELQTILSAK